MKANRTFTSHELGLLTLNNRIVMAPMTRSRAINNLANELMANYYSQRANAGLIIPVTEWSRICAHPGHLLGRTN